MLILQSQKIVKMEEDLDKVVEMYAAKLSSGQKEKIVEVHQELGGVYFSGDKGMTTFSRIVQELAAYQNGAVLEPLLSGALSMFESEDMDARISRFRTSCLAISILTSSDVVVKKILMGTGRIEDKQTACAIYQRLTFNTLIRAQALEQGQIDAATFDVVLPLQCLAKFIRSSRVFREAMKDVLEEQSIYDTLGFFLSPEFLNKLSDQGTASFIRVWLSEIAVSLAFSTDSQLWVLDMGLLRLMAAIYDTAQLQNLSDHMKQTDSPAFRCNAILLRLLEKEATTQKLRAHNALAGFRPHKQCGSAVPALELHRSKTSRKAYQLRPYASG